jgi:dTDP-4-dehydrorhamnose reductase
MKVKRVLITGATGFIGSHLVDTLKGRYELLLIDIDAKGKSWIKVLDAAEPKAVKNVVYEARPDAVIHLAGNKNLRYCEEHPEEAFRANTETTRLLAQASAEINARMVLISSDYVFDGMRGNYCEGDSPNPNTVYGKTKFESEKCVRALCSRYTILRSSAVYGFGGGFFDWVIMSLRMGREVTVFNDTYFSPTYIGDVTWAFDQIISGDRGGIWHVAGPEALSRYQMALEIAEYLELDLDLVKSGSVRDSDLPICLNSALNSVETSKVLGREFLGLRQGLKCLFGEPKVDN